MKEKEVLSQVYLFRELTPSEMDILISISKEKRVKKNEVIFKEGDIGDAFYMIVSGSVRISTIVPGVGEEALTILREGEYFGEMALIDDAPRSASAIANDDTILLVIDRRISEGSLPRIQELPINYSGYLQRHSPHACARLMNS
jgi:CRP-like cAMP-binding protein